MNTNFYKLCNDYKNKTKHKKLLPSKHNSMK